jgi:hypothetical protein
MRPAVGALVLLGSTPARAQGPSIEVLGGYFAMTGASESAEAVLGSRGGATFGIGARYDFRTHFFVSLEARRFAKEGERVFIADERSPVFRLGHPLSARIVPVYVTAGYRLRTRRALVPYAGLGTGFVSYREESTVGGFTESTSETKAEGHARLGVEYGRRSMRFAIEAQYSIVPNAIGVGGVSEIYGEDDIGGLSVVGKVAFKF